MELFELWTLKICHRPSFIFGDQLIKHTFPLVQTDDLYLIKTSIWVHSCLSVPLLFLGLGALFVVYTYCLVWPIMKTLVNGAGRPCSNQSRFGFKSKHQNQRIINTNTNYLSTLPLQETRGNTVDIKLFFSFTLQTVNFTKPFYARPVVLVTP